MIRKIDFTAPSPFELYLPEGTDPFPLICLTPILGRLLFLEDLFFERLFARFFASQGFAAALIDRPIFEFNPARGLEQIQEYLEESVVRNQKVLDSLLARNDIDSERVGTFGISFGAVANSLWARADSRPKAHVFVLGGGNIPEILVTSRDPLMKAYLQSMIKGTGIPKKNLKESLEKAISLDPLKEAHSIPTEQVFLLLGIFDRVIQFRYGLALWRALRKPKTYFLPLGHYFTLLAVPILKWRVLAFFRKKLQDETQSDVAQV